MNHVHPRTYLPSEPTYHATRYYLLQPGGRDPADLVTPLLCLTPSLTVTMALPSGTTPPSGT